MLSVGITDASLNYIQKQYAPDIRAYFYGDRRGQNIDMQGSPQFSFSPTFRGHAAAPDLRPPYDHTA